MKKVLVTGAGGYIGSVLVRMLLENNYQVKAVDRFFFGRQTLPPEADGFEIIQDDIRWLDSSILKGVEAVIDLAALSNDPSGELDPQKTWEINHAGRVRVAHMSKDNGVSRYIFPSSCSVYGFQDQLIDETSPVNPLTTYAQANFQAERDILPLADDRFCVVVIRQATVYGLSPRMRFDLAINGMIRGLFRDGRIPVLRDGTQWRPFIHVKDTARAMVSMLESPTSLINGQIFNVGSDEQNLQILPLAEGVAKATGLEFKYDWYGSPDHRSYRVSFQKIRQQLGYKVENTPENGAVEVYEALKNKILDPDDPRTITVQWYKHLLEMHQFIKQTEIKGALL
jgi:nucleoside-diphosphate-sugar epimerase